MLIRTNADAKKLADKVREYAKTRPDVTYTKKGEFCQNFTGKCSDGSIGCIVGQALVECGFVKTTQDQDQWNDAAIAGCYIVDPDDDADEFEFLDFMQELQDNGSTWGQALEEWENYCAERRCRRPSS